MDPVPAFSFAASYCGPPPAPPTLWARWNLDPVLLGALALALIAGLRLLRGADRRRQAAFVGGWGIAALLFVSPLCALGVALFSARVGHHAALMGLAAPLIALALPPRLGERAGLIAPLAVSSAALWLWHLPGLYALGFQHPAAYWAMQASLLGASVWLWAGLIHARAALPAGLAALGAASQMGLLGALLVFAPAPLYAPHLATTAPFGLSALEDQQLGGLILWVPAGLPLLGAALARLPALLSAGAGAVAR